MIIITIIIIVIIMIIVIMIIIQDYLQNTIDKINIRNFKKFKIMYNTKAFSLKNALKKKKTLDSRSGDVMFILQSKECSILL